MWNFAISEMSTNLKKFKTFDGWITSSEEKTPRDSKISWFRSTKFSKSSISLSNQCWSLWCSVTTGRVSGVACALPLVFFDTPASIKGGMLCLGTPPSTTSTEGLFVMEQIWNGKSKRKLLLTMIKNQNVWTTNLLSNGQSINIET